MKDKKLLSATPTEEIVDATFIRSMEMLRESYESGDNEAIFQAISLCAGFGEKMPQWLAVAFSEGWSRYRGAIPGPGDKPGKSTLGGAFGIVRPNNFKPYATRTRIYASLIWQFVQNERRRDPSIPIDEYLFERAAAELSPKDGGAGFYKAAYGFDLPESERKPIRGSTAKNMYYEYVKRHGLSDPQQTEVQEVFLEGRVIASPPNSTLSY